MTSNCAIDCRNDACPIPLLKASHQLNTMVSGEVLEVKTSYMCAAENIIEWAQKNKVIYWMEEDEEIGEMVIYLKKS